MLIYGYINVEVNLDYVIQKLKPVQLKYRKLMEINRIPARYLIYLIYFSMLIDWQWTRVYVMDSKLIAHFTKMISSFHKIRY